ncbi:MAG: hypothetical protein KKA79_02155 [Nanoarchaeota archaeon]|nr:hypothetical protein [Nanoarchaeota archaeon]
MKAKLFCYKLGKVDEAIRNKFRKELLGHNDSSHGGKYQYKRKGILDKIWNKKPIRSVIIVKDKDVNVIKQFLEKYNAKYELFNVTL